MSFQKETSFRLYVPNERGECLEIRPHPDHPETGIQLHTPDEASQKWFGKQDLLLDAGEARQLGNALLQFADQFDEDMA